MNPMRLLHAPRCTLLAGLLGSLGAFSSHAQYTFGSGSDGSNGALNITSNTTLALPPDGIFRCTTITIATNKVLTFTPNALNTPVYLLAQGDVTINGSIDVSGSAGIATFGGIGGPGGFAGGYPGTNGLSDGCGNGPGAGAVGGAASYGTSAVLTSLVFGTRTNGAVYGSPLLIPLVGGSGGTGSVGKGGVGGGGAVLIASNTRIQVNGNVTARSPSANYGAGFSGLGSGGAIRLVSPVVAGSGILNVTGSYNSLYNSEMVYGGAGRIRIDCNDRHWLALNFSPSSGVSSLGANMVVFPTNAPHLDITQVGTNNIAVGAGVPVLFTLPEGSSTNQNVIVQASNFGGNVPIRVVLTPDHGPSSSYDAQIDNSAPGSASVSVSVVVPVNEQVQVNAWTR